MRLAIIFLATQLAAATLTSTPATTCHINGAPCTTVAITPHPSWAPAIGGTEWISIAQTGWPLATWLPNGTAVSFSEVFSLASMPSSAMVTFAADDSAALWLNGNMVLAEASTVGNAYTVCSDTAPTCTAHTSVDVLPWLVLGDNVLRFDVAQRGGWNYGLNYAVGLLWLDEPLATPEPSTAEMVLLVLLIFFGIGWMRSSGMRDEYQARTAELKDALLNILATSKDEDSKAIARKALEE